MIPPMNVIHMMKKCREILLLLAWLSGCVVCIGVLLIYSNTPGEQGEGAEYLPQNSRIQLDEERATLVMYAHPHCPCTAASIEELARLQARLEGQFLTYIVFYVPENVDLSWEEKGLWDRASALADTVVIADRGGALSKLAGAEISGTVGLYSPDGRVQYFGGITPSRGHEGDNVGTIAVVDYFNGGTIQQYGTVYGCQITNELSVFNGEKQ